MIWALLYQRTSRVQEVNDLETFPPWHIPAPAPAASKGDNLRFLLRNKLAVPSAMLRPMSTLQPATRYIS